MRQLKRGDSECAIRNGEGPSGTIKLTGTQGDHIIYLGPAAGPERRSRHSQRARAEGIGP
jgi:hypothetical protein